MSNEWVNCLTYWLKPTVADRADRGHGDNIVFAQQWYRCQDSEQEKNPMLDYFEMDSLMQYINSFIYALRVT